MLVHSTELVSTLKPVGALAKQYELGLVDTGKGLNLQNFSGFK